MIRQSLRFFAEVSPTRASRNQTRITGAENNRPAHRLSGYDFIGIGIGIGIEIDFLDSIYRKAVHVQVCRIQVPWLFDPERDWEIAKQISCFF